MNAPRSSSASRRSTNLSDSNFVKTVVLMFEGSADAGHLAPEEAAEAGEGVTVAGGLLLFGGEAEGGEELWVGRGDVFVAVALGEPAVEGARQGAALREFGDRGEGRAEVFRLGDLQAVRLVVAAQGFEETLLAQEP